MTIFEKIVAGEIPCNKVLESEKFLAFNDINPKEVMHLHFHLLGGAKLGWSEGVADPQSTF